MHIELSGIPLVVNTLHLSFRTVFQIQSPIEVPMLESSGSRKFNLHYLYFGPDLLVGAGEHGDEQVHEHNRDEEEVNHLSAKSPFHA